MAVKCNTCFDTGMVKTIDMKEFKVILVKCPDCNIMSSRPTQEVRIKR